MNLLNIVGIGDSTRKSHIQNLISVALADGELASEEWNLLLSIAHQLDITDEEIENIKNNPGSVKFSAPKKYDDKIQQARDLVAIMMIDNDIDTKEVELCKKIALKLDLLPRVINDLVYEVYKAKYSEN